MKRLTFIALAAGLVGAAVSLEAQQAPPDIILTNGKIITVDAQFRIAQAVAVRGDRIMAVGTNQDITAMAGAGTRRIDLQGRSVVPGSSTTTRTSWRREAYWTLELRFDGVDSRQRALEMLRAKTQTVEPGAWVFNFGGWSPDQFVEDQEPVHTRRAG